ncbi:hypothetical protein B0H14DRAFT_3539458 [Mycena olivaceomarginata]|nr:hypothetical protein B0H14DRAFT_3539458 [Mycena olivaceomarginata]
MTKIKQILEEREAKITAQEAEKAKLMKEASGAASAEPEEPSGAEQRQDATKALEHEQHKNAELQKRLDALSGGGCPVSKTQSNAMGSETVALIVKSTKESWRALTGKVPGAQVPVDAKSKFFRVARKRHPILEQYENDWAAKRLRSNTSKQAAVTPTSMDGLKSQLSTTYLKDNSAKRDQSGSPEESPESPASESAGKNKAKQVVVDEEEEEEEEEEGSDARMSGTDSDKLSSRWLEIWSAGVSLLSTRLSRYSVLFTHPTMPALKMKDLGITSYCLGLEISQDLEAQTVYISQAHHHCLFTYTWNLEPHGDAKTMLPANISN